MLILTFQSNEKMLSALSPKVYAKNKQVFPANELEVAIAREWHNIPQTALENTWSLKLTTEYLML